MSSWIKRVLASTTVPEGVDHDAMVEVRLTGDPGTYRERAGTLTWVDTPPGEGQIEEYRRLVPEGVGDVNGTAAGTAARFNGSKPPLELIPAAILAKHLDYRETVAGMVEVVVWQDVLEALGGFQMGGTSDALYAALWMMDDDGQLWADCARVFDYGQKKYSPWNWARGQSWSIPIGSAIRHIVFGLCAGEQTDPESGLPHRGHIACNIVMLLWFAQHWQAGDDRYKPPV